MRTLFCRVRRLLRGEDGPTTVEYAIMIAFIVLTCIAAIQVIGVRTNAIFVDMDANLP